MYSESQINHTIGFLKEKNIRTVSLWGKININDTLWMLLKEHAIKVNYIIDKEHGGYINNIPVISLNESIERKEKNYIILSEKNSFSMSEALLKKNNKLLVITPPSYAELINQDPLNHELHYELAKKSYNNRNYILANSQLQNVIFLNKKNTKINHLKNKLKQNLNINLYEIPYNTYFRLKSLNDKIKKLSLDKNCTVLDVGGGDGYLKLFLDEKVNYFLAEPSINGISGLDLPFNDEEFDYVVSCHVLEHIPVKYRYKFLDQLLAKSKKGVILLNPFNIPGTLPMERLKLVIDITNSNWAKEHYECTLPKTEELKDYAIEKGINIEVEPNGNLLTSLAFVFSEYFANKSKSIEDIKKINTFYNKNYYNISNSSKTPNSYMVTFLK